MTKSVKGLLALVLLVVIGYQVYSHYTTAQAGISALVDGMTAGQLWLLVVIILLMPINWLAEAIKWRGLLSTPVPLAQAYRAVLMGNTVGLATPANIGDYAGRLSALDGKDYGQGLVATFLASISQNIVNVAVGLLGLCYLLVELHYANRSTAIGFLAVGFAVAVALILALPLIRSWTYRLLLRYRSHPVASALLKQKQLVSRSRIMQAMWWSSLRYSVYAVQYLVGLYAVGLSIPTDIAVAGIASIYLIQSGLPLPPMLGLLARGEAAIVIWGSTIGADIVLILAASFGLWLINRALASVIGLYLWSSNKVD